MKRAMTDQNNLISELRGKIMEEYERKPRPLYPRYTVRDLGREIKVGSFWIPEGFADKYQNKPVHEGVVVEVYKPVVREFKYRGEQVSILVKPVVNVGDHILFPHWSGDQKGLRDGMMKFIREDEIIAVVDYERKPGEERPVTLSGK